MPLELAYYVFRHGQRSPYPPPGDAVIPSGTSASGATRWSPRLLPEASAWNMTEHDFEHHLLTPNGHALMRHMGEYVASTLNVSCATPSALWADGSSERDIQSANAFASGFYPSACAQERSSHIVAATAENYPVLHPTASDKATVGTCTGPSEKEVTESFGGNFEALTQTYLAQIERVGSTIRCCSDEICTAHNLGSGCTLVDLPYSFAAGHFWSFFDGPLGVAAYYADAFMLQALSGLEFAWGELTIAGAAATRRAPKRRMRHCTCGTARARFGRVLAVAICSAPCTLRLSLTCASSLARPPHVCLPQS